MKYVKLIEKKKSYRSIYYAAVKHEDKTSITFIGMSDQQEDIFIKTIAKEDFYVETIDKGLFKRIADEVRLYRDKKLDSAQFDLDDETAKFQNCTDLIEEALK